jgi:hypothetical protein
MSQTDPTADNPSELPADDANGQDFGQLGALISRNAGAASVFGEAVEQAGVVVIPVASAIWGFGGGEKQRTRERGAGGGALVRPLGFIEIRNGQARFQRLGVPWLAAGAAALAGAGAALLLRHLQSRHQG